MEITLSIIGTAGRKEDAGRLSKASFDAMCIVAGGLIEQCQKSNYTITHLVSGGAAWSDHVAVKLFLDKKVPHLRLYLPAPFERGSYVENGEKSDGGVANYYHRQFQRTTNINSLTQLQIAKAEGAEFIPVDGGFKARNVWVSKSDFLLAMTFGKDNEVKPGGTSHTVECYLNRVKTEGIFDKSFHYDLNQGKVFMGCKVSKAETSGLLTSKHQIRKLTKLLKKP